MDRKFTIRRSATGLGLYALKRFKKGAFVIEYTGKLMKNEDADRKGGRYLFRVDDTWTVDGTGRENLSRYINHACKPNCIAYTEGRKIRIYAKRGIEPGEELTYDYGREYFDTYIGPKGCRCASCREANGRAAGRNGAAGHGASGRNGAPGRGASGARNGVDWR